MHKFNLLFYYVFSIYLVIPQCSKCLQGDVVTSISSGVNNSGTPLGSGISDSSYTLVSSSDPDVGTELYVAETSGFPFNGFWFANDEDSRWLVPYENGMVATGTSPAGEYVYRTTFDLAGFELATARIEGKWAVDENGTDILINGMSTGSATSNPGFSGFAEFSISNGFVLGENTLDFVTQNIDQETGNPVGIRVQGIVTATSVPEPSANSVLLLLGVFLSRCYRRRRI